MNMTLFALRQTGTAIEEDVVDEDVRIFYLHSKVVVVTEMEISRIQEQIKRIAARLLLVQTARFSQMSNGFDATFMGITVTRVHRPLKLNLYPCMLVTCLPRISFEIPKSWLLLDLCSTHDVPNNPDLEGVYCKI